MIKTSAIIVAAGKGERMGAGMNKAYLTLFNKTVIETAILPFSESGEIDEIIVVTDDVEKCTQLVGSMPKVKAVLLGGKTRQESVKIGLSAASGEFAAIHDGARALITKEEIESAVSAAKKYGAAALGVKCKDTLKIIDDNGFIAGTQDRERLYQIQTPQVFRTSEILEMHEKAVGNFTDDCAVMESFGGKIRLVEGSYENIKLTTPEDVLTAEKILEKRGFGK